MNDTIEHTSKRRNSRIARVTPCYDALPSPSPMTPILPATITPEDKRLSAKADAKLLKRIRTAAEKGDRRAMLNAMKLRDKARATYIAAASTEKEINGHGEW